MGNRNASNIEGVNQLRRIFGANFRMLRVSKGLTQRAIVGVPQKTVSAAELGSVDVRLSTMARLAAALNSDVAALLRPVPAD